MAIGSSGRIVIEIEPELKRQIYEVLDRDGLTLKEWFVSEAMQLLSNRVQLSLDFGDERSKPEQSNHGFKRGKRVLG